MNKTASTLAIEVKDYVAARRAKRKDLLSERLELRAERDALLDAPLDRADAKQFIFDYIDARAAEYPARVGLLDVFESVAYPRRFPWPSPGSIRPGLGKAAPLRMRDIGPALTGSDSDQENIFAGGLRFFGAASTINKNTDFAAYFFFGDIIKAKIETHFDAMFPNYILADAELVGPPISERRVRIESLESKIEAIDAEIEEIDAEMRDLVPDAASALARRG